MKAEVNDESLLLHLIIAANKVRASVEPVFLANPVLTQPIIRMSSRVKSVRRAYNKLSRLRVTEPRSTASDIPDLLGFRFVSLFNGGMIETLESIMDLISTPKGALPFECGCCDILLYTARPENDPLSIKGHVDNFLAQKQGKNFTYEVHIPETLYSSLHVITRCMVEVDQFNGPPIELPLRVEIQLRTAMEDVWGQISHLTSYSQQGAAQSANVANHLNALKQLIDGCALYAGLIKIDADIGLAAAKEINEKPISAGDPATNKLRNVPQQISEAFKAAIALQGTAMKIEDSFANPESSSPAFAEAAAVFEEIEAKIRACSDLEEADRSEAIYKTQMERAFCLLYTNKKPEMNEALTIYSLIAQGNSSDAICRLRLGQTLRRKGEIEKARDELEKAKKLVLDRVDPRVTNPERILRSTYQELGIVYFTIASKIGPDQRLDLVRLAVEAAEESRNLVDPDDRAGCLAGTNNLLYYLWEAMRLEEGGPVVQDRLEQLLAEVDTEDITMVVPVAKQDAVYDTICRIYGYLKREKEEGSTAFKTIKAINKKVKRRTSSDAETFEWATMERVLTADELDTYQYAVSVVSRCLMKSKEVL